MDKSKIYQQHMEKALKFFESTSEWADLVNALGKVNKVLQNYPQFSRIPCDAILGRRLAQCLHPGLPNGVQLKALETYDMLFKAIGSEHLMQELSKFSNGLFPLLGHADLNIKPALLDLFEAHFLPLKARLRPALDGFLLATLHGLEENTDFYQRTDNLLLKVCEGVGAEHFYGSLWRCILKDPSIRLHGLNFLIAHFNKRRPLEEQSHILGTSNEALVQALCVSLLDIKNVLVQRASLDVLLSCFPLHNQRISKQEMTKLATAAITVLLRRDTSLTRRLLAWLFNLGPGRAKDAKIQKSTSNDPPRSREQREKENRRSYFLECAKPIIADAFNNCLADHRHECWSSLGEYWHYRLLICVVDHPELCELVIDDLCIELLRALDSDIRHDGGQRPEFIRTIRLLMTSMELSYIWTRMFQLLQVACEIRKSSPDTISSNYERRIQNVAAGPTNILELCECYDLLIVCYPFEAFSEIAGKFIPQILLDLLGLICEHSDTLLAKEYVALIAVIKKVFIGLNVISQDDSISVTEATVINPTQRPFSSEMSQVTEEEEYLPEEIVSERISTSENNCDTVTFDSIIQKFQELFHLFVSNTLLDAKTSPIYEEFAKRIEDKYSDDTTCTSNNHQTAKNDELVSVHEAFCDILAIICDTPATDETQPNELPAQKLTFTTCSPFVQDLMILACKIDDLAINYSSMKILVKLLCRSQFELDADFALFNQPTKPVAPSFADELNSTDPYSSIEKKPEETVRKRLLLSNDEYYYITRDTCWFTMSMRILWQSLTKVPTKWVDTVDLIQSMHNLTYQTLVCEDIICASLNSSNERVAHEARRRFVLLFSLMKDERSHLNLRQREFERPLFIVLDSLTNKMDPFNCIAKDWLVQVYKSHFLPRILEPILKILLHVDTARIPIIFTKVNLSTIHHTHMHLYSQVYDSRRILYAMNILLNVLSSDPYQSLMSMASTSIKSCTNLHILYARHCNTLIGNQFHDDIPLDNRFQTPSFLELTIGICLNFLSSYYTQLPNTRLSRADIQGNHKVRMLSCEILRTIFSHLFDATRGCPTQPIHDLLNRSKAQETILLLLVTLVQCTQHQNEVCQQYSSEQLLHFNEISNDDSDDFQKSLLRLLQELMILEYRVAPPNVISETENHSRSARTRDIPDLSSNSLKYFYNILISSQRLFLSVVKAALQNVARSDLHVVWLSMIEATLPISGRSLTRWIVCIISRLCDNLERISDDILNHHEPAMTLSPRYLIMTINSLKLITHYCLIESGGSQTSNSPSRRPDSLSILTTSDADNYATTTGSTTTLASSNSMGPVSIMSNIFHVFSSDSVQDSGSQANIFASQSDPISTARKEILSKLSQIIYALVQVWKVINLSDYAYIVLGSPSEVKKRILSLLSPISLSHGKQFMNAIASVWYELRIRSKNDICLTDQRLLVELVASMSDLPINLVIQTITSVVSKSQDLGGAIRDPPEVSLLQFFLEYIRLFPGSQLIECWKPLVQLIREALQLGRPAMPRAQFILLALLHEFVQTAPHIDSRKDQKDLQDLAQRLIDIHLLVIGSPLGQPRWLRRTLEVEPSPHLGMIEDDLEGLETRGDTRSYDIPADTDATSNSGADPGSPSLTSLQSSSQTADQNSYLRRYTIQALDSLAEYLAPVLDVLYAGDEKDKVATLIGSLMSYIYPYLRNHSRQNARSFLASTHLLSNLSGYQYTRKAWRKETFELFLDPQFFNMGRACMDFWRIIIDHLMTHDKTTLRDFLGRITFGQSTKALNLFTNSEKEIEARAQLIKRMAFVLFCSERDQYQKYTPEIQEKLIEALRDNPPDVVQAQIMLCFRVLIIRSSAHLLTSLWPFVYTEMIQGLLQIEAYVEQSIGDTATTNSLSDEPDKMQMFLYTCKLLDMVLALPADSLPQFQMYRWAFIGGGDEFEPHLVRIERRLTEVSHCSELLPYRSHYPLLTLTKIDTLLDLHPFFRTLVKANRGELEDGTIEGRHGADENPLKYIDDILASDFLDL